MAKDKPTRAAKQLPDVALVTVQLDRATGRVEVMDEFSTPMETWAMLAQACAISSATIDEVNDTHKEEL